MATGGKTEFSPRLYIHPKTKCKIEMNCRISFSLFFIHFFNPFLKCSLDSDVSWHCRQGQFWWLMELSWRFMDWYFDTCCLRPHLRPSGAKSSVFSRDIYIFCICRAQHFSPLKKSRFSSDPAKTGSDLWVLMTLTTVQGTDNVV